MNDMMSVVYITQTGHVIGAVSCNSDPNRTLTPTDVAGSDTAGPGFLLTAPMTVPAPPAPPPGQFFVPASVLSVSQPVKFNESVFQSAEDFAVSGGVVAASNAPVPSGAGAWTVNLHATTLEIDLPTSLSVDTPVWAQIQDPPSSLSPQILVLADTIPKLTSPVNLPLTILPKGAPGSVITGNNYSVALMVGGYAPIFDNLTAA